jgi:hypothetical protein
MQNSFPSGSAIVTHRCGPCVASCRNLAPWPVSCSITAGTFSAPTQTSRCHRFLTVLASRKNRPRRTGPGLNGGTLTSQLAWRQSPDLATYRAASGSAILTVTRLSLDRWQPAIDVPAGRLSGPVCRTRMHAQRWAERQIARAGR